MKTESPIPFYRPQNFYQEDPYFAQLIRRYLPVETMEWAEAYFQSMGQLAAQKINPLVLTSDQHPPELRSYTPTGERINAVDYHESYQKIAKLTYEFGIIGLGHSTEFQQQKRVYGPLVKFGIGYLFSQAGSVLYCPICMTDGTLQLLERYASETLKQRWIPRITSMNYENFCDSGMYLTEAQGGSDVGANTCRAYSENGVWKLSGKKWFCSNAGSDLAMVLARPDGAPEGTAGLGLFLVPRELEDGTPNAILIDRIKPKLGTCEMATAELTFEGAVAYPVGELEKGFSYMTDMLNLSRTYNAIWSIGLMQRAYLEARYYAAHRQAFGKKIDAYPLVQQTLQTMAVDSQKALALVFETLSYLERVEQGQGSTEDETLLRLLTPIIKFYTAEKAIEASHRAIEIFGGNGCVEDFPVAKLLRDAQILAIWEGTANILCLDLLRVMKKTQAHEVFLVKTQEQLQKLPAEERANFQTRLEQLKQNCDEVLAGQDGVGGQLQCRPLAIQMAEFFQDLLWRQEQKIEKLIAAEGKIPLRWTPSSLRKYRES